MDPGAFEIHLAPPTLQTDEAGAGKSEKRLFNSCDPPSSTDGIYSYSDSSSESSALTRMDRNVLPEHCSSTKKDQFHRRQCGGMDV